MDNIIIYFKYIFHSDMLFMMEIIEINIHMMIQIMNFKFLDFLVLDVF